MNIKKKILILLTIFFIGLIILYRFDPVFKRKVSFENYSVEYEWRLFNNSYCNSKTAGHCYTNETNNINAEIKMCRKMLDDFNGQENIKKKLIEIVNNTYRFNVSYYELTKTKNIKIDSLIKYKDEIFKIIILK